MWRKLVQSTYLRKSRQRARPGRNPFYVHREFVGGLARFWAAIEGNLDHWIEEIHANGGWTKIQKQLPPNLDRELDYLKAAIREGLIPAEDEDEVCRLIQEIHRLKNFRHTLIHGYVLEISPDGRVLVEHARVRGAVRVRSRSTYSQAQMSRHYARTDQLQRDLWCFLTGEDLPEELR